MDILLLGGTSFVGRHIVETALRREHSVTIFNRGQTDPDLFADAGEVTQLQGDRETGDYASLSQGRWDATIDVTAYVPRHVQELAEALDAKAAAQGRGGWHLLVSTVSVYDNDSLDVRDETAPRTEPETDTEEVNNDTYGALKVACEDIASEVYGEHLTVVRPGIVAGPHDPTERFTAWVRRVAAGGRMPVPKRLDQPVQVIDVRDLAEFVVDLVESLTGGTYDAVGPADPTTLAGMIETIASTVADPAEPVQIPHEVFEKLDAHLPLMLPSNGSLDGLFLRSGERARAAGLRHRELVDTVGATRAWDRQRGEPAIEGWPSPELEQELLSHPKG